MVISIASEKPLVDFMIVGAQKCGTTALAYFLSQHPELCMSSVKENHLFDAVSYDSSLTVEQIDEIYRPTFAHFEQGQLKGEATPIYLYWPEIMPQLKRYNPDLKLIVLLRNPVDRAISQYYMEKGRGFERFPLWLALLLEPLRLKHCRDHRALQSSSRVHSYRARGFYSIQLENLYRHFDKSQVLVIASERLRTRHHDSLLEIYRFLGVDESVRVEPETVFHTEKGGKKHSFVRFFLKLSYVFEFLRRKRQRNQSAGRLY